MRLSRWIFSRDKFRFVGRVNNYRFAAATRDITIGLQLPERQNFNFHVFKDYYIIILMAKILFVIAKNGFRDVEYFTPKEILEKAGHSVKTASNGKTGEIANGADEGKVKIDIDISDADADDFDAVVFVGGPGALENLDNEESYRLAREVSAKKKLLAAICIAPAILAKAGVLKNRKATVWTSVSDKSAVEILRKK